MHISPKKQFRMSNLVNDDSSDDDMLYTINSDLSESDDGDIGEDIESSQSSDDTSDTTNGNQYESWSGKIFKPSLPHYDGALKLSADVESKMPRNPTVIDFFSIILNIRINFLYSGSIKFVSNSN